MLPDGVSKLNLLTLSCKCVVYLASWFFCLRLAAGTRRNLTFTFCSVNVPVGVVTDPRFLGLCSRMVHFRVNMPRTDSFALGLRTVRHANVVAQSTTEFAIYQTMPDHQAKAWSCCSQSRSSFAQPVAEVRSACCSCHDINLKGRYRSDLQLPYTMLALPTMRPETARATRSNTVHTLTIASGISRVYNALLDWRDMPCSTLPACK